MGHGGTSVGTPVLMRAGQWGLGPWPCLHRACEKLSSTRQITLELKRVCVIKPDTIYSVAQVIRKSVPLRDRQSQGREV